ncbi:MAG: hypothetical protein LBE22_10315 [Azoarcus sp.]|jgi:hypothetical protein|nr:hypothetical protein [Azoarcus sp.]
MIPINKTQLIALAIAVVASIAGYMAGSAVQSGKTAAAKSQLAAEQLAWEGERLKAAEVYAQSLADARAKEQAWQNAANESEKENVKLRIEKDAATRAAADAVRRLRDAGVAATNSLPPDTSSACLRVARAAADALGECGDRLVEVAEQSDRCEIERRTLIGAWPK